MNLYYKNLALFVIIALELLFNVDVIGVIFYISYIIISYTSILGNIFLFSTIYILRNSTYFQASFGILIICYSFDYLVSSSIAGLLLCLSSIILAIPIMSSIQLSSVYILMSTITLTMYWCGIIIGINYYDIIAIYSCFTLILMLIVWSISLAPRLGNILLILIQVISKIYIYISCIVLFPSNSTCNVILFIPSIILIFSILFGGLDIKISILILSSVWLIQLSSLASVIGLSYFLAIYFVLYIFLSIILIILLNSSRTLSDLCLLITTVLIWSGMPLLLISLFKLLLIISIISWNTLLMNLSIIIVWSFCTIKIVLLLLTDYISYPIWFLTSVPIIYVLYGVITSFCILIFLGLLIRGFILLDLTSSTSDNTDSFECGYNSSDFSSIDILDLRILICLYVLFDTELWFLILSITTSNFYYIIFSYLVVVYFFYTFIELFIML